MAENPQINGNNEPETDQEKPIETMVSTIMKSQAKQKIGVKQGKTYDVLYNDIKEVLSGLDLTIGDCKKYNEAKIHRKYQIRISDLENEVKILRDKLKEQQNARSPSKKYIQDLVDQLVLYKFQNEKLKKQIEDLKANPNIEPVNTHPINTTPIMPQYKSQYIKSSNSLIETNMTEPKTNIRSQVTQFLTKQQTIRKITEEPRSKFESFLKKKMKVVGQWTFLQFLAQVNAWFNDLQSAKQQKLSSRLRSNVLSTLEDEIPSMPTYKLPKIGTPTTILRSFPQILGGSGPGVNRVVKQRQKSRQNYSTVEVVRGGRPEYRLK